tara:strand:- start:107 stop:337 length:231 start_codon:yes stop_codon:yes gene_type:complete
MGFLKAPAPPAPVQQTAPVQPDPVITPSAVKETKNVTKGTAVKKGQSAALVTGGQGLMTEAPTQVPTLLGQNKVSY